jgi:hypothetical protein
VTGGVPSYELELTFDKVNGPFSIAITDAPVNQSNFTGEGGTFNSNFPNYRCVPIAGGNGLDGGCVQFELADGANPAAPPPDASSTTWDNTGTNGYTVVFDWAAPTDGAFPDAPGGRIRVLRATSESDGIYNLDITIPGSYTTCGPLDNCPDPGIGGFGKSFSTTDFTIAQAPLPEPTSIALVTTGLVGLLYRRRSRKDRSHS